MFLPVRLALTNLLCRFRPAPTRYLRPLVRKESRAEKELLYLGLHARGQVGSFFQFSHAIVPDRHKDETRIFYRPISALLDKIDHAEAEGTERQARRQRDKALPTEALVFVPNPHHRRNADSCSRRARTIPW